MRSRRRMTGALAATLAVLLTAGGIAPKVQAAEEVIATESVSKASSEFEAGSSSQTRSGSNAATSEPASESSAAVPEAVAENPAPTTEPSTSVPPELAPSTPPTEIPTPATEQPTTEPTTTTPPEPTAPSTEPATSTPSEPNPPVTETPVTEPTTSAPPEPTAPSTEPTPPTPSETAPPVTETPSSEPSSTEVHLGIDNRHLYSGMTTTYSQGYTPSATVSSATLVVPFTADGPLKNDRLTVSLEFSSTGTVPFEMKNYQKDVDKKTVYFDQKGKVLKEKAGAAESAEAYVYRVKLQFLSTAEPGQYPVTVKALGYTEKGEKVTLEYRLFVRISEKDDSDVVVIGGNEPSGGGGDYSGGGGSAETEKIIHQPKMLLDTCNLSGKTLEAGSEETLTAAFQNRSLSEEMYNLKITAASSSAGLKLRKNSWYFAKVSPGENATLESLLTVAKDAESAENTLTFTFEYEDSKGTASTGTETLSLTVTQPVRMELESADFPAVVYASDTEELTVKALNLSRTKVYNARISLSGTGLFPTEEVFLGNLDAGTEGEGVMKVYVGTRTMEAIGNDPGTTDAEKYGPVSGTLTLTYEDALGTVHEETKDYQTEIKKAQILSLNVAEEKETGNSWWYSIFAVVTVFLILLILALIGSLRRKSRLLKEAGR